MACEHLDTCLLVEHMGSVSPSILNMLKKAYCERDPFRCARYWLHQNFAPEQIPSDLWPHEELKALEMVKHLP